MTEFRLELHIPHDTKVIDLMAFAIELDAVIRADDAGIYMKSKQTGRQFRVVVDYAEVET